MAKSTVRVSHESWKLIHKHKFALAAGGKAEYRVNTDDWEAEIEDDTKAELEKLAPGQGIDVQIAALFAGRA